MRVDRQTSGLTRQELHGAVQAGIAEIQLPITRVGETLARIGAHGGLAALRGHYDRAWGEFAARRRRILQAVTKVAVQRRATAISRAATAQAGYAVRVAPALEGRAVTQSLARPLGALRWTLGDLWWPRDRWIKRTFFAALTDAFARRERLRRRELDGSAWWPRDLQAATPKAARPTIDPRHKKIDYPIDSTMTDAELIERAADTVVVARGEYYAAVGMHDAVRAADQALIRMVSGEIPQIGAWQWTLSPAHNPAKCDGQVCDALADTDLGFGPGVYLDVLLPESHVGCMCVWEAVWLEPGEAAPEAGDDYEDAVRGLMDSLGVTMLGCAAGDGRAAGGG